MKVRLDSDFHDFYDHQFCGSWEMPDYIFERQSRTGLKRREQFRLLQQAGFDVPLCGSVQAVAQQALAERRAPHLPAVCLVVYLDELAHCGEGKTLLTYYQAFADYPDHFCSQFIQSCKESQLAISQRLLYIGDRGFWLQYTATNSWRSNYANKVEITSLEAVIPTRPPTLQAYPLLAIDFVTDYKTGKRYAIDLNTAPGLKRTPIEALLLARDVYNLLVDRMINA